MLFPSKFPSFVMSYRRQNSAPSSGPSASVTSAVQLTANGITEILKIPCDVRMEANRISLTLDRQEGEAVHFLQALQLHLTVLSEDYPNTITILVSEV